MEAIDAHNYRSYGQRIVAVQLDIIGGIPEVGSKLVGSDQNQRRRLIILSYVNWSLYVYRTIGKSWWSHHREFREKKYATIGRPILLYDGCVAIISSLCAYFCTNSHITVFRNNSQGILFNKLRFQVFLAININSNVNLFHI